MDYGQIIINRNNPKTGQVEYWKQLDIKNLGNIIHKYNIEVGTPIHIHGIASLVVTNVMTWGHYYYIEVI